MREDLKDLVVRAELSQEAVVELVAGLRTDDIYEVYSGRHGCGCGCRGSYSQKPFLKTRTLNLMRQSVEWVKVTNGILSLETETRSYWLYLGGFGHERVSSAAVV